MALNSTHPDYAANLPNWELMNDAYEGEAHVKSKTFKYLPATQSMHLDGLKLPDDIGSKSYAAYLTRAVFPDYVSDAVEMYIGLLHSKPPTIELPAQMEPLRERATSEGESLEALLRRINEHQLVRGRLGLLLDLPLNPDPTQPLPYIALYAGDAPINWDTSNDGIDVDKLNLVVLNESAPVRLTNLEWTQKERYRVLMLGPVVQPDNGTEGTPGEQGSAVEADDPTELPGVDVYSQGVFEIGNGASDFDPGQMRTPMLRGQTLDEIPFVFINSKDCLATPDNPPLLGLARLCMTIYRGEADYRQSLYMQGQDTLVIIGGTTTSVDGVDGGEAQRVGAGATIKTDIGGDAKYIGVSATGLPEQRTALENDRKVAEAKAGTMINPAAGTQESGQHLTTRLTAQTASLTQIAKTGAGALEWLLKLAARWMGADPEAVKVSPNLEFTPTLLTGQEVTQLMAARTMGAPISLKSLHGVFVDRGLTSMTFEEELDAIAEEDADRAKRVAALPQPPAPPAPAPAPGSDPNDPGNAPAPAPEPAPAKK